MDLIVDTNIVLAAALDEPEKVEIVRLTSGANIAAPEILPYEIGNALTAMCKRRQITPEEALAVHTVIQRIPVRLLAVNIGGALDIALQFSIYAYDAYFLDCALRLNAPLLTLDRKLMTVAKNLGIIIWEV